MFVENGTVRNFDMCRPCKGFYLFSFLFPFFLFCRPEMFDLNFKTTEVSPPVNFIMNNEGYAGAT